MPSFLVPLRLDAARIEIFSRLSLSVVTEGYIVPRASHKTVTSNACRGKKPLVIQQADSEISYKISDIMSQRMSGGVGGGGREVTPYPYMPLQVTLSTWFS
jgi:hypothetical protein